MKGLPRSLSRGSAARNPVTKQTVRVRGLVCNVDGATGVGFGTAVIGDLPEGNILLLGAVGYLAAQTTNVGVVTTFNPTAAIGSAPTADATLSGAEVDILPATALGAATARVSPRGRLTNATQVVLDNTDGSLELNLNVNVPDADISANGVPITFDGEVFLSYVVLADD